MAYELTLPTDLAFVSSIFHESMLKKCIGYPLSVLPFEALGVDEYLSFEEQVDFHSEGVVEKSSCLWC